MLCIRESCFTPLSFEGEGLEVRRETNEHFQIFENSKKILVILYNPYETIHHLREIARDKTKAIVVYVFSMSAEIWDEEISHISSTIRIEAIPDEILETYKKIFGF